MKAEYIDHMGDDLRVVNAARVSFKKESEWDEYTITTIPSHQHKQLNERDTKLIRYLAKHNHWTPFSHALVTLRETIPIFVARQRFKHTVGFSYNEVSRRYVDDTPEFFAPKYWRKSASNKKQGSSDEEIKRIIFRGINETWEADIFDLYWQHMESSERLYECMIEGGVAPEQARMVLPQSTYTSYYVTGSLAAWARAYKLRSDPHAQKEIQDLAQMWNDVIAPLFPVSWPALARASDNVG